MPNKSPLLRHLTRRPLLAVAVFITMFWGGFALGKLTFDAASTVLPGWLMCLLGLAGLWIVHLSSEAITRQLAAANQTGGRMTIWAILLVLGYSLAAGTATLWFCLGLSWQI